MGYGDSVMEVQIEKRNESLVGQSAERRLFPKPAVSSADDVILFQAISDGGVLFLFVLCDPGQWCIKRDGVTVAGGAGNSTSIEAGVRAYRTLTASPCFFSPSRKSDNRER
jgi:hypothetical protein